MQKTLEDYRTIAKLLKLDILRIKVSTDDIRKKLGQPEQSPEQSSAMNPETVASRDYLASLYRAMQLFSQELTRLALTPELLFRLADDTGKKCIRTDKFTNILSKLKAQLPKQTIDILCLQLDARKDGNMELSHYLATVSAFQISTEAFPASTKIGYAELCFSKLAWSCRQESADLSILDSDKPIDFVDFRKLVQKQVPSISETELIAVYLTFDKGRQFRIPTDVLYKRLTEEIKEVVAGRRRQPVDLLNDSKLQLTTTTKPKDALKEKKTNEFENRLKPIEGSPKSTLPIEDILTQCAISFDELFERLLLAASESTGRTAPLQRSFVRTQVSEMLQKSCKGRKLTNGEAFSLFRELDMDQNGSISIEQMCRFFRRYKKPKQNHTPMLSTMAYMIEAEGYSAETFLQKNAIIKDSKISLSKFTEVFQAFGWADKQFEPVYVEIRGTAPVLLGSRFIEVFDRHVAKLPSEKNLPSSNREAVLAPLLKDLKKLENDFANLPKSSSNNFLIRKQLSHKQNQVSWNSIFTSEVEAFRFCYQTLQNSLSTQVKGASSDWHWRDSQFGPNSSDPHGINSILDASSKTMKFLPEESEIEWMRPTNYLKALSQRTKKTLAAPIFMQPDLKMNDVVPSSGFGNGWFVAAIGFISNYEQLLVGSRGKIVHNLLQGIHPPLFQPFAEHSIYTFKFYKDKQPVYVVIDDTFPVNSATLDPLFSRSTSPNCLWAILIEKAYAKLHGSYSNIQFGHTPEALTDLTGLVCIKTQLPELNSEADLDNWKMETETHLRKGWLLGCSASKLKKNSNNGIVEQSLYSIKSLVQIQDVFKQNLGKSVKLVCLRNSQANAEWRGEWSQYQVKSLGKQAKLSKNMKLIQEYFRTKNQQNKKGREDEVQEYTIKEGDGTFMMDAREWFSIFDTLFSVVTDRSITKKMRTREAWGAVIQGGFPKTQESIQNFYKVNYSYKLEVQNETEAVLELSGGRMYEGAASHETNIPLALFVVRSTTGTLPEGYSKKDVVASHPLERRRTISLSFKAEKGVYFLVPCTEEQPNKRPYPQFCLEVMVDGSAAKLPSAFRQVQPPNPKLDPTIEALHRKLTDICRDLSRK